jgi:hypothetical protein
MSVDLALEPAETLGAISGRIFFPPFFPHRPGRGPSSGLVIEGAGGGALRIHGKTARPRCGASAASLGAVLGAASPFALAAASSALSRVPIGYTRPIRRTLATTRLACRASAAEVLNLYSCRER